MRKRFFLFLIVLLGTCLTLHADKNNRLTPYEKLSPFWIEYFNEVDDCINENFWGSLNIFLKTKFFHDPYIAQLEAMGYCFEEGHEKPARFYDSLNWIFQELQNHIDEERLTDQDVLWPGKAFEIINESGEKTYCFVPIGGHVPENALPLNLLTPEVFVCMLASGYFPIGNAIREHTNQTLAEHDLAHMAGFVSSPNFTKAVREAFRRVLVKMQNNPRVANALKEFDSAYSLRLYYTIEVFTEIPKANLEQLQALIEIPLDIDVNKAYIDEFLLNKANEPAKLYHYLHNLYWAFHHLVNPLGGESRDVLNRRRKFNRDGTLGSFYDNVSQSSSKFARNSLYSLFLNARASLENKRSNHPDFRKTIVEIHAPFIGALIGTSQLEIEDWVLQCIEEIPDPESKLYRYFHDSGLWSQDHLILKAFCHPEYDKKL